MNTQMNTIEFKTGMKVRIIHLEGEDNRYDGHVGVIDHIDAIGQLHLNNCGLAIIPEADEFEIIK